MTATTQHAAIEALVTAWTGTITVPWGENAETLTVAVHDGPDSVNDDDYIAVWVGHNPLDDESTVVTSKQEWAQLGARRKEETGTIVCCVGAWSGDSSTKNRRVAAASVLSQAEALHRADPTLGGAVLMSNFGESVELHQQLTDEGNEVLVVFTVDFLSRT